MSPIVIGLLFAAIVCFILSFALPRRDLLFWALGLAVLAILWFLFGGNLVGAEALDDPVTNTPPVPSFPVFDTTTLIALVTGSFIPWLIAWFQRQEWPDTWRAVSAFASIAIAGILVNYLTKTFTGTWTDDWQQNLYIVIYNLAWTFAAAWQTFSRLWVHLPVFQKVQAS